MLRTGEDLWRLVQGRQYIDPHDLAAAVEDQVARGDLDYRSRVLIRDSVDALRHYWGAERLEDWLEGCPVRQQIQAICSQEFEDDRGFSSLRSRVMDVTQPDTIRQYFEELGRQIHRPLRLQIGGSIALILPGYLSRSTGDIDVVDELPAELRSQHRLLNDLNKRYGLELAHFQRHYLPMGWEQRVHSLGAFGQLQISLVDVYDVFLSKLYSARTKDRDDLRALIPQLDKEVLVSKLKDHTQSMLATPALRQKAETNWQILYGEPLPA